MYLCSRCEWDKIEEHAKLTSRSQISGRTDFVATLACLECDSNTDHVAV